MAHKPVRLSRTRALLAQQRLLDARQLLGEVVAADPRNAAAWHELGLTWRAQRDTPAYEQAVKCLARASELEPKNATYLANYGGTSLELAGRTRSFSAARKGRDALERAVALDPANLDAREGLHQFYRGFARRYAEWIEVMPDASRNDRDVRKDLLIMSTPSRPWRPLHEASCCARTHSIHVNRR